MKTSLQKSDVDLNIREFIEKINSFAFVKTLHSCEGHGEDKKSYKYPYVALEFIKQKQLLWFVFYLCSHYPFEIYVIDDSSVTIKSRRFHSTIENRTRLKKGVIKALNRIKKNLQ